MGPDTAILEREKLLAAHSLVTAHLRREEHKRLKKARGMPSLRVSNKPPPWEVPIECMRELWRIANSDTAAPVRPRTAPPMLEAEGWGIDAGVLNSIPPSECHPVPAGVSSSGLSGGSGGAPRPQGYVETNDRPSLEFGRPPNLSAIHSGEFRRDNNPMNWGKEVPD